jgi:UDPglucose 6-dehydrogenase
MKCIIVLLLILFNTQYYRENRCGEPTKPYLPKKIAIVGSGYVGLITGAVLSNYNHLVTCVDIDSEKIANLNQGHVPIYEPGLPVLIQQNITKKCLVFTTDLVKAVKENDIVIIAVGTPMDDTGKADLSALKSAITTIAQNINSYKIICIKSTVPIGTHQMVHRLLKSEAPVNAVYDIVSNPEFLRQGTALNDFLNHNPIILGSSSQDALDCMQELYEPILQSKKLKLIRTDAATAEAVKYAHNCYLATRICFVNELAHLCIATGADISNIIETLADGEQMYPTNKLKPGPGIGGSCLPKDTNALVYNAKEYGVNLKLIQTVIDSNSEQKEKMLVYLTQLLGGVIRDKKVCILGLSFKANTDDIRYSPALRFIEYLLDQGATIQAYDPQAMKHMQKLFPTVTYCNDIYTAAYDTNALIILTEWDEFRNVNLEKISNSMRQKIIFDTRNILEPQALQQYGFNYLNLGRTK